MKRAPRCGAFSLVGASDGPRSRGVFLYHRSRRPAERHRTRGPVVVSNQLEQHFDVDVVTAFVNRLGTDEALAQGRFAAGDGAVEAAPVCLAQSLGNDDIEAGAHDFISAIPE